MLRCQKSRASLAHVVQQQHTHLCTCAARHDEHVMRTWPRVGRQSRLHLTFADRAARRVRAPPDTRRALPAPCSSSAVAGPREQAVCVAACSAPSPSARCTLAPQCSTKLAFARLQHGQVSHPVRLGRASRGVRVLARFCAAACNGGIGAFLAAAPSCPSRVQRLRAGVCALVSDCCPSLSAAQRASARRTHGCVLLTVEACRASEAAARCRVSPPPCPSASPQRQLRRRSTAAARTCLLCRARACRSLRCAPLRTSTVAAASPCPTTLTVAQRSRAHLRSSRRRRCASSSSSLQPYRVWKAQASRAAMRSS